MSIVATIRQNLRQIVSAALVSGPLIVAAPGDAHADSGPYRIAGQYVEACSCTRICESALLGPGRAACTFVAALRIDAGQRGDVPLGGLALAVVGAPPEGGRGRPGSESQRPIAAIYVDSRANPAQVEALVAIAQERFGMRLNGPVAGPRPAGIHVERSTEVVAIAIEGVAEVRGRPLIGGFHRLVQLQYAPGSPFPVLFLARVAHGQVADGISGARFEVDGRSMLYGKFDVSDATGRRRK